VSVRVFYDPHRVEELRQKGITGRRQLAAGPASEARTALELVEECARLRAEIERLWRDNQHLTDEVARLRGEASSLRQRSAPDQDDSVRRFSLLELE
jgi:predicted RNase H-like nuclease (RuvC/YqgF family)